MSKYVMAVATYYKLFKDGDKYTLEHKTEIDKAKLVPRRHIDRINSQYKQSGKYYIIDEEATDISFAEGAIKVAETKQAQEDAAELGKVMADTLRAVKTSKKAKVKAVEVIEVEVDEAYNEARAEYIALFNKKPNAQAKTETLLRQIDAELEKREDSEE